MPEAERSKNKGYLIPLRLVNRAAREGIALPKLQEMVRRAARITHPQGNRRFHEYLFSIVGNRVEDFQLLEQQHEEAVMYFKCESCSDTGKVAVFDECPACAGVGCAKCDEGLVKSSIPCPMCKQEVPLTFRRRKMHG